VRSICEGVTDNWFEVTAAGLVVVVRASRRVAVGDWVKQHELHSGYDEEHEALIIDEDKVRRAACF
jgi:broad-specificity NMP kinase